MRILTTPIFPPIPTRSCDWMAIDESTYDPSDFDYETGHYFGGSPIGRGATQAEAIDDLLEQINNRD